jgi:hypothetical protein
LIIGQPAEQLFGFSMTGRQACRPPLCQVSARKKTHSLGVDFLSYTEELSQPQRWQLTLDNGKSASQLSGKAVLRTKEFDVPVLAPNIVWIVACPSIFGDPAIQ